jgi:hypothetical protein
MQQMRVVTISVNLYQAVTVSVFRGDRLCQINGQIPRFVE